jgi:glycosyltransferase involved in cell wall biosynthesis
MADAFNPLVSIVIPVYNGSNYLAQAIDSALAQTYKNIEIIVVNDGSNDGGKTRKLALSYGRRIRYFEKENGGAGTALNLGIENMKGEYFSWLSHDDMYNPRKVEIQVNMASRFAEPVVVYSNASILSTTAPIVHNKILPQAKRSIRCFLAFDVTTGIDGCSLLVPRVLFERYGNFDPMLRYTQDYDLWFRLTNHVPFVGVDECLVISRSHPEQVGRKKPIECTKAGDDIHAYMVENIAEDELKDFIRGNIDYVLKSYRTYKNACFYKTATNILSAIEKYSDPFDWSRCKAELVDDLLQWPGQNLAELSSDLGEFDPKRKKRILIYSNIFAIGGIERVISIVTQYLKDDYDIFLVSGETDRTKVLPLPAEVKHLKIRNADFGSLPERLTLLCIALGIDIFIGCPNHVERFLDTYSCLRGAGVKTIAWNHTSYFLPMELDWLMPVACKRNDIYKNVTATVWLTQFSTWIYSGVNPNGVLMPNPNTFTEEPEEVIACDRREKIILCVGRFYDTIKRVDLMFKAFRKVLDLVPDAKLCLVGDYDVNARVPSTSEITIRELLEQLGLNDNSLIFVGETDKIRDYYQKASILMLTSDSEGFGLVLNEAAHMGVPAIMFEIPGLEDIVTHGKSGYIVPRYDFDDMAKKIAAVLTDGDLRRSLGKNAQEMSRRFSQRIIGKRWKDLIGTILGCDSQVELNALLSKKFAPKIEDRDQFVRRVIQYYERLVIGFIQSPKGLGSTVAFTPQNNCDGTGMRQRMKKYRIARFGYYRLFNPYVRPIFRTVKGTLKANSLFSRFMPYLRNPRLLPSLPRKIARKCLVALGINPQKVRTFFGFNANNNRGIVPGAPLDLKCGEIDKHQSRNVEDKALFTAQPKKNELIHLENPPLQCEILPDKNKAA